MVETKGGQCQFTAKHILLTSNTNPSKWYRVPNFNAFIRRVENWIITKKDHEMVICIDYIDFIIQYLNLYPPEPYATGFAP